MTGKETRGWVRTFVPHSPGLPSLPTCTPVRTPRRALPLGGSPEEEPQEELQRVEWETAEETGSSKHPRRGTWPPSPLWAY